MNLVKSKELTLYLDKVPKDELFYISVTAVYENILIYLDRKSIFNGLLLTCKKLQYLAFMENTEIWHDLIHRDFPKIYAKEYKFCVPYLCQVPDPDNFTRNILSHSVNKRIFFTKMRNDNFWKIALKISQLNNEDNFDILSNADIQRQLNEISWKKIFCGKDQDFGRNGYQQLLNLRFSVFINGFMDNKKLLLASDEEIFKFICLLKRGFKSGLSIFYLNPFIK